MGEVRTEPSMEDILASIKRIIADDGPAPPAPATLPAEAAPLPALDPVLDQSPPEPAASPPPIATPAPAPAAPQPATNLVSEGTAVASRHALSSLSSMVLRTPGTDNTLDALVRDMLRPLLKEWLDARLPDLVETLVEREIARITGSQL